MSISIEMLLWALDRETFANTMVSHPAGRAHIAWLATEEAPGRSRDQPRSGHSTSSCATRSARS